MQGFVRDFTWQHLDLIVNLEDVSYLRRAGLLASVGVSQHGGVGVSDQMVEAILWSMVKKGPSAIGLEEDKNGDARFTEEELVRRAKEAERILNEWEEDVKQVQERVKALSGVDVLDDQAYFVECNTDAAHVTSPRQQDESNKGENLSHIDVEEYLYTREEVEERKARANPLRGFVGAGDDVIDSRQREEELQWRKGTRDRVILTDLPSLIEERDKAKAELELYKRAITKAFLPEKEKEKENLEVVRVEVGVEVEDDDAIEEVGGHEVALALGDGHGDGGGGASMEEDHIEETPVAVPMPIIEKKRSMEFSKAEEALKSAAREPFVVLESNEQCDREGSARKKGRAAPQVVLESNEHLDEDVIVKETPSQIPEQDMSVQVTLKKHESVKESADAEDNVASVPFLARKENNHLCNEEEGDKREGKNRKHKSIAAVTETLEEASSLGRGKRARSAPKRLQEYVVAEARKHQERQHEDSPRSTKEVQSTGEKNVRQELAKTKRMNKRLAAELSDREEEIKKLKEEIDTLKNQKMKMKENQQLSAEKATTSNGLDDEKDRSRPDSAKASPRKRQRVVKTRAEIKKDTVFGNISFILTGFSSIDEQALTNSIEENGGSVLDEIPSPGMGSERSSNTIIIVAKNKTLTLKVLFGLCTNVPIVTETWV